MDNDMQLALERMRNDISHAQHTADGAVNDISSHEKICALRYETITTKLDSVPKIFDQIAALSRIVYIGMGIWLAVMGLGTVIGIVYTILRLAHGG